MTSPKDVIIFQVFNESMFGNELLGEVKVGLDSLKDEKPKKMELEVGLWVLLVVNRVLVGEEEAKGVSEGDFVCDLPLYLH